MRLKAGQAIQTAQHAVQKVRRASAEHRTCNNEGRELPCESGILYCSVVKGLSSVEMCTEMCTDSRAWEKEGGARTK